MRIFMIVDDSGILYRDLPDDEITTGFGYLTMSQETRAKLSADDIKFLEEKFPKTPTGTVHLVRILKSFPDEA